MKRKFKCLLLGMCIYAGMISPAYGKILTYDGQNHEYNLPPISLYVNDKKVETTVMDPVSIDGRVLVPAREVFEPLGASVCWHADSKQVIIDYNGSTMILTANKQDVLLDNKTVQLDVPAKIINEKIMIPVRFVSETMGLKVNWISSTYSVYISDKNSSDSNINNNTNSNTGNGSNIKDEEQPNIKEPNYGPGTVTNNGYFGTTNIHNLNINALEAARANVKSVTVSEMQNKVTATINLSSALSDADISVANGKVIIDIKNSTNYLPNSSVPTSNTYIERIRTSQFTADTTRVVFDLKSGAIANAYLQNSRTQLVIELQKQNLEEISVAAGNNKDTIFFKNLFNSQISFNKATNSLNFKINNSYISEAVTLDRFNANYISRITLTPKGNNVEGTIYLNTDIDYAVSASNAGTTVTLSEVKETGDIYNNGTIYLAQESGVSKNKLTFTDNYRSRQLIIDLGGDYSTYFQTGTIAVNDAHVKNIQVTNNGTTKLTINTQVVKAFNISETSSGVAISLVKPSEKYDKIVVIDPGHGGSDSGAVAYGLTEKAINLKHAQAVANLLVKNTDIKVYLTRETDEFPTLQFRTALANEIDADLFVSFHNNSASSAVTGTETLYYPSTTDTRGKQVAKLIQDSMIKYCNTVDRGIKPRSDLYVLRTSNMPAVLIEAGFITNQAEAARINSEDFIRGFGQAVYEAIVASFDII